MTSSEVVSRDAQAVEGLLKKIPQEQLTNWGGEVRCLIADRRNGG